MRLSSHTSIQEIPVEKNRLIAKLQENKETHSRQYKEAMEGFKDAVLEDLAKQIKTLQTWVEKVEASTPEQISKRVPVTCQRPENHTSDYEEVIDMMNWTTEKEVKLSTTDFNAYVRDNWDWRQTFASTHMAYNKAL